MNGKVKRQNVGNTINMINGALLSVLTMAVILFGIASIAALNIDKWLP